MKIETLIELENFCVEYRKQLEKKLIESLIVIGLYEECKLVEENGLPDTILVKPEILKRAKEKMAGYAIIKESNDLPKKTFMQLQWKTK